MKKIYEQQISIYETANYSRPMQKWLMKKELLVELEIAVIDYIEEAVSYANTEEKHDLKEMIVIGAIEEVITALEKGSDLYTAKEILYRLEDYVSKK